ncbi:hypothetical protein ACOSQ2_031839 [Xanthoceras sorbifolium]
MKNLNQALLPKAAQRLLHSNGSLWSEILKCKYLKGRSVLDSVEDKGVNSCVWKGIKHGAKGILEGIVWRGGVWNYRVVFGVLPIYIVEKISSIQAGRSSSGEDIPIRGMARSGDFNVKYAYDSIADNCDIGDWKWRLIWKLKIHPN